MSDIKIFVSHRIDQESVRIENPLYYDVRCGAVFDDKISDIPGDDTGDNISEKRMSFCELTVQYWAWKNVKADYYGICHYRRYLSFADEKFEESIVLNTNGCVKYPYLNNEAIEKFCLNEESMRSKIEPFDMVVNVKVNVPKTSPFKNVYDSIEQNKLWHNIEDFNKACKILLAKHPDFERALQEYLNSKYTRMYSCFIMKKELFEAYNKWLFDILFELEPQIDTTNYNANMKRSIGTISEKLFGVYCTYLYQQKKYKISERQLVFFEDATYNSPVKPAFQNNNIPVCLFSSDEYVPYCGTLIQSIICNSTSNNNYDIIILEKSISGRNKHLLEDLCHGHTNFSVRLINVACYSSRIKVTVHDHFAIEGCYRTLLLTSLFENYDKVISLDSDLIVERDIANLFELDIDQYYMAASRDVIMDYLLAIEAPSGGKTGGIKTYEYITDYLGLDDTRKYRNTGVVLFNLQKCRKMQKFDEILTLLNKRDYWFLEQDVLNVALSDSALDLDMRWNTLTGDGNKEAMKNWIAETSYDQFKDCRSDYYIIHFAGGQKPWINTNGDFADIFFKYARMTPWYEMILHGIMWRTSDYFTQKSKITTFGGWVKISIRKIADLIFPKGSKRRKKFKKVYFRLRGWPTNNI